MTSSFMSTAATFGLLVLLSRIAFVGLAMFVSSYCVTFLSLCACRSCRAVAGFDCLDGIFKRLLQNTSADGPKHDAEHLPLEGLAFAHDNHIYLGRAVGLTRKGVDVTRRASPCVGVGRRKDDAVGIGPVVIQSLPDTARALRDISVRSEERRVG